MSMTLSGFLADKYDAYTDEQLLEVLTTFQTTAGSYIAQ